AGCSRDKVWFGFPGSAARLHFPVKPDKPSFNPRRDTMPYEIQSKLREQKAMGGLPSNWKIEFVDASDKDHIRFVNIDFTGGYEPSDAEAIADRILAALNQ